jgi:hypothetical protein
MRYIHLADDDVLVYLHIPKTAGTSLISILDKQFGRHEVFPFHSVSEIGGLHDIPLNAHKRYKFVRGHFRLGPFDRCVYRYIVQNPLVFTVLRDPVERTLSAFRHIWRHQENSLHEEFAARNVSLLDFVTSPKFAARVVNHQARQIAGALVPRPMRWITTGGLHQEVLLQIALEKLEQFCFVGLTERFEDSVRVLAAVFGWDLPQELPELNQAPLASRREQLSEEELAAIEAATEVDRCVYEAAKRRFAVDWEEMVRLGSELQEGMGDG